MSGFLLVLLEGFYKVVQNDYVLKLALFGAFYTLLQSVITAVKNMLFPYLLELSTLSANITFILCKVDFFGAMNLYLSALLSIFVFKQIIGFTKG